MGRFVKKGEKGIRIMAPAPYKMDKEREKLGEDGKPILDHDGEPVKETVQVTINAFKPVSTFDLSQTDGEPVPEFGPTELTGSVDGYATLFEAIKAIVPVPVTFEQIDSGAKGYFHTEDNRIAINEGMSEVQNIKTLIHEASHQKLHSKEAMKDGEPKSRNQKETEAEGIAYVVSSHFNIDCGDYTFPYLASWSSGLEVPELKASLDTIRSAASEMITAIEEKIQELTASKEQVSEKTEGFSEVGEGVAVPFPDAQPSGVIKIDPPAKVDETPEKPIKLSVEGAEKKSSVKKNLTEKKEKSAKTPRPKKSSNKQMQEAI